MSTIKGVTRKRYTRRVLGSAINLGVSGKLVSEVAQDLGIGSSVFYGWVRKQGQPA